MPRSKTTYIIHQQDGEIQFYSLYKTRNTKKSADRLAQKFADETQTTFIYYLLSDNRKAKRLNKQLKVNIVEPRRNYVTKI